MDIVKWLRSMPWANGAKTSGDERFDEAANEIERLREALRWYANFADAPPNANVVTLMMDCGKIAHAVLKETE